MRVCLLGTQYYLGMLKGMINVLTGDRIINQYFKYIFKIKINMKKIITILFFSFYNLNGRHYSGEIRKCISRTYDYNI